MKKKFNLFDVMVILGIFALVFLFVNRNALKGEIVEGKAKKVRLTCFIEEADLSALETLKPGDTLFAQYKFQNGKITGVKIKEKEDLEVGPDGKLALVKSNNKHSAWVDLETEVLFDGPYMQAGGQEVKAGIDYIVKTEGTTFNSEIIFVEEINENN
ncbi:MAG: DUF4330 family protein [Tissierellia bacterium]|nr:DUF4330 family protein [Tissierellia bacterium]